MMPRLSTPIAVLVTIILASALIFYVFAGDGEESRPEAAARCASQQIHDQIKRELFQRAAVIRGGNDPAFAQVGAYSVVRATAPAVRRREGGSGAACTAPIVLDLPPGVEAIGGRRSLAARVAYSVEAGPDGRSRLRTLGEAQAIVLPLATIGQTGGPAEELVPTAAGTEPLPDEVPSASAEQPPPPREAPTPVAENRRNTRPPPPEPRATPTAAPRPRKPAAEAPPRQPSPAPAPRPTARAEEPRAPAPAPQAVATARPSFDCRRARTRGEVAVCSDPALASLDRQMASQFYRALSTSSPGARLMLQRTRTRFLRYRDSCRSSECIADAYVARMREISDIAERF